MITEVTCKDSHFLLSFPSFLYSKERWDKVIKFFWKENFWNSISGIRKSKCYQNYHLNFQKPERRSSRHPSRNDLKRQDQGQQYFFTPKFHRDLVTRKTTIQILDGVCQEKWANHILSGILHLILKTLLEKKKKIALYLKTETTFTFLMDIILWRN